VEGLDSTSYTVIRRFNDFDWLRRQLRSTLPYLFVPALPEKQNIGRFNQARVPLVFRCPFIIMEYFMQDFVDIRHRALQRWMERVTAHPSMATAGA
jgi:hypothetical protein